MLASKLQGPSSLTRLCMQVLHGSHIPSHSSSP